MEILNIRQKILVSIIAFLFAEYFFLFQQDLNTKLTDFFFFLLFCWYVLVSSLWLVKIENLADQMDDE